MTAVLEGGEWSAARPGRTLPLGKTRYPFYRRLGGPQGQCGWAENLVTTGFDPVQPVVSRFTDWASRPTPHLKPTLKRTVELYLYPQSGSSRLLLGWHLLTYSMVQSPSWEANWFAASPEIPRNSRNPKVHYHTHKRPSPVSILGQPNPVHIHTSHLLEIHPNITHPSTSRVITYYFCILSAYYCKTLRRNQTD